jgi:lipopolysaccharide transport system ATP-binding protein
MSDVAIRAQGLYKKFRRGEMYDSLRDLVPALIKRSLRGSEGTLRDREFWAMRDVSFEVKKGEAFGVIGHNGAGKSTLLKHLCGIMLPTQGSLEVNGRLSALIEVGAGFHEDLTGRENVYLYGTILGMSREEIRRKFDAIVEFSGIGEFIDTPVKRYSSGMYARLGFSVAAHVSPDVLVVDEVLSVGDYVFQRKGVERMKAVLDSGTTVVFVSHDLHAVAGLCHRAMLMENGQVVRIGDTTDVIRAYLERADVPVDDGLDLDARLSRIELRGALGETLRFESCQKVVVNVQVEARRACHRLAVVLECVDEGQYPVFNTSTERLGTGTFDLEPGESFTTTFEMRLNLAPGTYQMGAHLYRYDTQRNYHSRMPATTFYVTAPTDVRGVAHLEPSIRRFEKGTLEGL